MSTRLSQKQIGKRVLDKRKQKGLSQEELAQFLKIPRSSLAQIELGNRSLSAIELITLSKVLGFSLDQFVAKESHEAEEISLVNEPDGVKSYTRISTPQLNIKKLSNVVLYILEQCAGKPNVGETVLYKLLYFSDFNYYEIYEEHLSGSEYRKLPYGPVPQKFDSIIGEMIIKKQIMRFITEYHGYPQTRYIPLKKADLKIFNAAEKEVVDQVIERFSDWSASVISDYSHRDMPWRATKEGDIIDYELSFYREPPFSARTYFDEPLEL